METTALKDIVIMYHAHCYDGFGAAYAAWKKFGENASYVPCLNRDEYPESVYEKEVYVADFCFSEVVTRQLQERNTSLVILDHHASSREIVESAEGSVFSETDSGAKIAWKYFHPNTEVPKLIDYISDSDTWKHSLPYWQEIEGYIHAGELSFPTFEALHQELQNNLGGAIEKGKLLTDYFNKLVDEHVEKAMLVEFEGYEVYAVNASSFLRSELGHRLATKKGPFSIVYRFEGGDLKVSLRGDGTIDCTKLAEKYGGGGHENAAAFIIKGKNPLPFRKI